MRLVFADFAETQSTVELARGRVDLQDLQTYGPARRAGGGDQLSDDRRADAAPLEFRIDLDQRERDRLRRIDHMLEADDLSAHREHNQAVRMEELGEVV